MRCCPSMTTQVKGVLRVSHDSAKQVFGPTGLDHVHDVVEELLTLLRGPVVVSLVDGDNQHLVCPIEGLVDVNDVALHRIQQLPLRGGL